jgi:hypothetical protein
MKNKGIKVIKRVNALAARIVPATVIIGTIEEVTRRQRSVVKKWIIERHEKSRLERIFTNEQIDMWKTLQ